MPANRALDLEDPPSRGRACLLLLEKVPVGVLVPASLGHL